MNAAALTAPAVCVAALVGLGVGAGMAQPQAGQVAAPRSGSAPVEAVTLVCPSVTGSVAGLVTTMSVADLGVALPGGQKNVSVTAVPLPSVAQNATPTTKPTLSAALAKPFTLTPAPVATVRKTAPFGGIAVVARGPGAAHVVADQIGLQGQGLGRASTDSSCLPPAGDWWFAGADGRVGFGAALLIANPTDTLANVAVTAWSATGVVRLAGLDALTVPPRSTIGLRVARFAPNARDVALHVHALSGSIVASITLRRIYGILPGGGEWLPPAAAPATDFVVNGLPSGPGFRHLQIANPGNRDATVALRVLTRTGDFEPAGHQSVVVPAGHTADVDLSSALGEEPAAVVGKSDQPVIAEGRMTAHVRAQYDDSAWLPAAAPMSGPAGLAANTPPFDQDAYLVLAAPQSAVRVRLAAPNGGSIVLNVPAGRVVEVDPAAVLHAKTLGALVFVPLDPGPVYAARVLYAKGVHGPLISTEVPLVMPAPIVLPPVVEDPRAATR